MRRIMQASTNDHVGHVSASRIRTSLWRSRITADLLAKGSLPASDTFCRLFLRATRTRERSSSSDSDPSTTRNRSRERANDRAFWRNAAAENRKSAIAFEWPRKQKSEVGAERQKEWGRGGGEKKQPSREADEQGFYGWRKWKNLPANLAERAQTLTTTGVGERPPVCARKIKAS